MKNLSFLFLLLWTVSAKSQLVQISTFNPPGLSSLCALGYDGDLHKVWVYDCNGDSLHCFDTTGVKLASVLAPGEPANDVDLEIAPVAFQLAGTLIPQGTLLFINGETDSAEIYAINPLTGQVLDTLFTSFGNSHVVGGAYHIPSGTFFLVQDNVPGALLENRIGEVNVLTGQLIQSYQIGSLFNVSYGDMEGAENGHLYVVSSVEDSILEMTIQGQLVQMHDLPPGVSNLSGFDFDCGGAAVWVCNTSGSVYHLGQSNCNSATGVDQANEILDEYSAFPNPSIDVFYFDKEVDILGVYNVYGERVLPAIIKARLIDLKNFSSGVYFLQTVDGSIVRLVRL